MQASPFPYHAGGRGAADAPAALLPLPPQLHCKLEAEHVFVWFEATPVLHPPGTGDQRQLSSPASSRSDCLRQMQLFLSMRSASVDGEKRPKAEP